MFVLDSNHFWKCFFVNVSIWLRMKNKFSGNTFQLTVCFSWFDPEMVWSENFHFKPFPDSRAKRERDRTQITPRTQSPEPFDFDFELHPDRTLWLHRRTQSPGHAFDFAEIAPQDCTKMAPIALRSQLSNGWVLMNLIGFDEFFLVGFCSCVYLLKNCIINLFGSWQNVGKCEEQIIFWDATKHLKIFLFPQIAFPENILHEPNTA